jgi:hypothetical protein
MDIWVLFPFGRICFPNNLSPAPFPYKGRGNITKRGANAPLKHPSTELEIYQVKELDWKGAKPPSKKLPLSYLGEGFKG